MKKLTLLLALQLLVKVLFAQNVTYYSNIDQTKSGNALKTDLASLISSTHQNIISYSAAYQLMQPANQDATNTANVILIYSGVSDLKTNYYGTGGSGNASSGWNREHIFPKSLANPNLGTSGAGADAHNLAPCTSSINSARGNKMFESGAGTYGSVSTTGWYPGDDWRGDVARAVFYMDLRYGNQCDASDVGDLSLLLLWNSVDPVSALEDQRNDQIFLVQGNRNPFIDNPNFATKIWGGPSAQDRFTGAIADPINASLSAGSNDVQFSITANSQNHDILIAYTGANSNFGNPSGNYSIGAGINGGGTVIYQGSANAAPAHTGLSSSTVYQYKFWSVDANNNYSNGIERSISTGGGATINVYQNSFEQGAQDNWSFTSTPSAYDLNSDLWNYTNSNGSQANGSDGPNFWGIRDLNNNNGGGNFDHELIFQVIDISNLSNVSFSFDYYAEGFDNGDELKYELLYDGSSQGETIAFQGGSGGLGSNGWQNVSINIPDQVNQVQLKLIANQDGGGDYGGFDNVQLNSAIEEPGLSLNAFSPTAINATISANANNDSILLVYGSGSALVFSGASGLYQTGQSFQSIGQVAYFGPANSLPPITNLSEGGDYSFAAYSFNGRSYSLPKVERITLPDAESTGGSSQIYFQGFEGGINDNWSISTGSSELSQATGTNDFPPQERIRTGSGSWQVNNKSATLELSQVNTSSADSLRVIVHISSTALTSGNGADGSDELKFYLNINNQGFGINPDLTLSGNNNAKWGYDTYTSGSGSLTSTGLIRVETGQNLQNSPAGGGYRSTDAYDEVNFSLSNVSSIALRIVVNNNSSNEIWNIDDISIESLSNALVWNGAAWKDGLTPGPNTDNLDLIIYPGEDAEINEAVKVNSIDLRTNSSLRISPNGSLSTDQIIQNLGELLLEADNSGTGSFIGPSANLTMEYYINRAGWQPIAFPFSNSTFMDIEFTNGGFINYASSAGLTACTTCNLYYYDVNQTNTANIGESGTTAFGTWVAVHDSTALIDQNIGYYLFLGPDNFGAIPMVLRLSGLSRSGNIAIQTNDANGGWNLIPNPFPTAIDWSVKNDFGAEGFNTSYWIYNGSTFSTYSAGIGINGANGNIPAGQAFFVHSASPLSGAARNTRNFGFGSGLRAQNNRVRHKHQQYQSIHLVSGLVEENFSNEIALSLESTASVDFDTEEDVIMAGTKDQRSFYFQVNNNTPVVIRRDPPSKGRQYFPLYIGEELRENGFIYLKESTVLAQQHYYLLDNKTGVYNKLSASDSLWIAGLQGPFALVLSDTELSENSLEESFWYAHNDQYYICSAKQWTSLMLYNQYGQLVLESKQYALDFEIPASLKSGIYLAVITSSKEKQKLKLLIQR